MTTVRFALGDHVKYNSTQVQSFLAEESNELLVAMEKAINATPPPPPPAPGQPQNGTVIRLWAVFRMQYDNTTIEFYACEDDGGFECVYGIISSIYSTSRSRTLRLQPRMSIS